MSYEFRRLSDVEALTEVPAGANALIEVDGDIKRVPGSGLGGATGIKTAIIKDSEYDACLSYFSTMVSGSTLTYECTNMTFEEAYETMSNGEPLSVFGMFSGESATNIYGSAAFLGTSMGVQCIMLVFMFSTDYSLMLFWTADGISNSAPSGGK